MLARENLPWLRTIYWHRLVEINQSSQNNPKGFGLFYLNWTAKPTAEEYGKVIPEFDPRAISLLFLGTTLATVVFYRRKR
jgi:hypothetical protein